jgi:hypothetical protein
MLRSQPASEDLGLLDGPQKRALVTGLLLRNGRDGGNSANNHFRLTTRWLPFVR